MNILGYLITLANIQNFRNSGGPLKDLSINVSELQTLYSELLAIPGLDVTRFADTGYYRYKDVGKYLSKNLRDYIYYDMGSPTDKGVILTLVFDEENGKSITDDDTMSLFLHKDIGHEEKEQVQAYLDDRLNRAKRNSVKKGADIWADI